MKGVVVVLSTAGVAMAADPGGPAGFVRPPWPNPTRGSLSFEFALRSAGRARATVFDVRGREVAVPLDRALEAGAWRAAWDGLTRAGSPAAPGVYYLRLELPGRVTTRAVAVVH